MALHVVNTPPTPPCSFCGKRASEVHMMVKGVTPLARMCDACVFESIAVVIGHRLLDTHNPEVAATGKQLVEQLVTFGKQTRA